MDMLQELHQREMLFRVSSKLQDKHTYKLEEILLCRGTFPGQDHIKLKYNDSFVYTDRYGTYFQKPGAITLYLDNVLEMNLSSYTPEQIESMKKQQMLDMIYEKCYTSLFQYFDEFSLMLRDKSIYPIGMNVTNNITMIHGSYNPERASIDVFCDLKGLKKVLR